MYYLKIKNWKLKIILLFLLLLPLTTSASTLSKAPNNLGLVGYWSFSEGVGTKVTDSSGKGNTGTITGATWTSGKLGKALSFNGTSDYVNIPDTGTILDFSNTSTYTWSQWLNFGSISGNQCFMSKDRGALDKVNGFNFCLKQTGSTADVVVCKYATSGDDALTCSTGLSLSITQNQWANVSVTYDGASNWGVYLNGVYKGSMPLAVFSDTSSSYYLGAGEAVVADASQYPGWFFSGKIDDVRVYNRALSATEVSNLYKSGSVKMNSSQNSNLKNGLVGLWTMDGADTVWTTQTAGTVVDRSGNGNTGTLTNMNRTTSPIAGKLGQGLKFDGVDDYVSILHDDILNPAEITISYWVKFASCPPNNNGSLIDKNYTTGYRIRVGSSDCAPQFVFNGVPQVSGTAPQLNTWTHYVLVGNSSGTRFYKNGIAGTLDTDPYVANASTGSLLIAKGATLINIPASLDDVRIYNRALSVAEVKQLYQMGGDKINSSQNSKLTSGLVGMWSFNGADINWGTGTAYDRSGNGNNGSIKNMSTTTSPVAGKLGQALRFDGSNSLVEVLDTGTILDFSATGTYTWSTWLNIISTSTTQCFLSKDLPSPPASKVNGFNLCLQQTGNTADVVVCKYANSTDALPTCSTGLNLNIASNQWSNVSITYDGASNWGVYLNGLYKGTMSLSVLSDTTASYYIGAGQKALTAAGAHFPGLFYSGKIDEVRIYNRALSASEVKQLYLMGK